MEQSKNQKVITRFAPSPTGELHIGGARTGLFAYIFAKHVGGEFLLRIEDTDRSRMVKGATERIIDSLKWLDVVPDNLDNVMIQSERIDIYKKYTLQLIKQDHAYICTCTKEELEADRAEQIKSGKPPRYSGKCRNRLVDSRLRGNDKNERGNDKKESQDDNSPNIKILDGYLLKGATVRMKMAQDGKIVVNDLIRGKVEFDAGLLDDQIILKSDGFPTYHLASVVDDHEMGVTHVIRAEEWLPSTPKHLILYKYLGWRAPEFAHLSMILATDKSKLSKRHGAVSVLDYQKLGYLPEAIVNAIALLGWNPKTTEENFSLKEIVAQFKIENVNKAAAIFDIAKLNNFNEHYLSSKTVAELIESVKPFGVEPTKTETELLKRGGYATLGEMSGYIIKLRQTPKYSADLLIFKKSSKEATLKGIKGSLGELMGSTGSPQGGDKGENWGEENLQASLSKVVEKEGLNNGDVFWPVRVALSGEEKSPSPVELLLALGKKESFKRLEVAVKKLG